MVGQGGLGEGASGQAGAGRGLRGPRRPLRGATSTTAGIDPDVSGTMTPSADVDAPGDTRIDAKAVPPILAYLHPNEPSAPIIRRVDTARLLLTVSLQLAKLPSVEDAGAEAVLAPFARPRKVAYPEASQVADDDIQGGLADRGERDGGGEDVDKGDGRRVALPAEGGGQAAAVRCYGWGGDWEGVQAYEVYPGEEERYRGRERLDRIARFRRTCWSKVEVSMPPFIYPRCFSSTTHPFAFYNVYYAFGAPRVNASSTRYPERLLTNNSRRKGREAHELRGYSRRRKRT